MLLRHAAEIHHSKSRCAGRTTTRLRTRVTAWPNWRSAPPLERVLASKITAMVVRHELSDGEDGGLSAERTALYEVLVANTWNLRRAAQAIGISRGTLYRRMEALRLKRPPRVSQVF